MRVSASGSSALSILLLILLAIGPSFYLPLVVHNNSNSVDVHFADSLSMPLPAIPLPSANQAVPISGVLKVLIVAVEFSDVNHTKSIDEIRQAYLGTVANYYKEVSYGAVTLQGDVVGWYRLNVSMSYYGRDCTTIDDSDCGGQPTSWWLARDAADIASNIGKASFANYDYFVFLHAGVGEESSKNKDTIWSVAYLNGVWIRVKDRSFGTFDIVPEMEDNGAVPLGVYTHEFGHLIGLPDLYDTSTGKTIMGPWSLMDKGLWNGNPPGSSPAHMEAWSRIKLGWLNGSLLAVANDGAVANYTIDPNEVQSSRVHVIKIPITTSSTGSPPNQYYLVEVRQRIGFDQGLPSTGVLITFVDERPYYRKVSVVDAHPNYPGLSNATWSVGQVFSDDRNNIAIAITAQSGKAFQITVNRLGPLPDLTIARIFTRPTELKPNTTVTIFIDINNQGTAGVTNVPVQIFLDGQPYASKQVTLGPQSSTEITLTWTAVAGSHTIRVLIDPYDTLNELNRANNQATYTLSVGPTLIITVPLSVTSGNAPTWVRVNGVTYNANGSQVRTTVAAGQVTIEVQPSVYTSNGSRQSFVGWSDGSSQNPRQITVNTDTSLTAVYKTQYLLAINRNGGVTTQSGWYDSNSLVTVAAASPINVTEQASRMLFTNWSGDVTSTSTSLSLNMTKPIALTANWKLQYYLNIISTMGAPSGSGWYDAGSSVTISVQSPIVLQNNTRQVFVGWNGGVVGQETTKTIVMNAPTVVQVSWKTQYLVQIQSAYGNPQGSGWYDAGTQLPVSIPPQIVYSNRTRRIFVGWSGDYFGTNPSFTLQVSSPKALTANWITQYELSFRVSGLPNTTYAKLNINNAYHDISVPKGYRDWFNRGSQINPTINQTLIDGFLSFQLVGFFNSTGSKVVPPFAVTGPMDYIAVYQQTFPLLMIPGFPVESILLGLIIGAVAVGLLRRRPGKFD